MSPSPRHIAVIDIGKTNVKLVLIDGQNFQQIATLSQPNRVLDDGPYPHYDIEGIWQFILDGLKALHRDHGVDGISITTHGATAALIAGDGLAMPVLDYEYGGPENCASAYGAVRGGFSETLSPRLPNGLNLGAQIFWQAHAFAAEFSRVTDILMYPQFWAWKLTGLKASEVTSLGTHTDLWSPDARDFSGLVEGQGWRVLMPDIHPAASTLGMITSEIVAATGLPAATPVACGIHDSNASLLPYLGTLEKPFTVISSGTWTIVMSVGGDTGKLDQARDSLANVDAFGQPVPTARFMGGREYDVLMGDVRRLAQAGDIDFVIENGVFILPTFEPGVGPYPDHAGCWIGDDTHLAPNQRAGAVSLYLALMARTCLDLAGCGACVVVEGPLARDEMFASVLSALIGVPVYCSPDATGTSTGAAMLFGEQAQTLDLGDAVTSFGNGDLQAYGQKWQTLVAAR